MRQFMHDLGFVPCSAPRTCAKSGKGLGLQRPAGWDRQEGHTIGGKGIRADALAHELHHLRDWRKTRLDRRRRPQGKVVAAHHAVGACRRDHLVAADVHRRQVGCHRIGHLPDIGR